MFWANPRTLLQVMPQVGTEESKGLHKFVETAYLRPLACQTAEQAGETKLAWSNGAADKSYCSPDCLPSPPRWGRCKHDKV